MNKTLLSQFVMGVSGILFLGGNTNAVMNFPVVISTYSAIVSTPTTQAKPPVASAAPLVSTPTLVAATPTVAISTPAILISSVALSISTPVVSTVAVVAPTVPAVSTGSVIATQAIIPPSLPAVLSVASVGQKVTLDLKDMDVIEVLKMLSKQQNINLVIDKNVSGRVTLMVNQVDFWEAFKAILNSRDLAFAKVGALIEVMTGQEYERQYGVPFAKTTEMVVIPLQNAKAKTAKDMLDPIKSKVGTISADEVTNSLIIDDNPANVAVMKDMITKFDVPREMRVFRLSYANAEDLQPKISPLLSKDYGNLQIDKRSNSLMVEDNPARMKQIEEMVHSFDVRNKSVLIEAKIMQVLLNKTFESGVNWQGVNWSYILDRLNGYHVMGGFVQNLLQVPATSVAAGNVTAQGLTATVGVLEKPGFNFVINLLNTIGTTNLLSSPRVMALNNQEAKIHVGTKAAKITRTVLNVGSTTSNPVTTENVEFLDVGVKLSVTPSIGDDGTITMKVHPEVSSVENTITTSEGSSIPVIRVSEADASLVVKDGLTAILGGLIENSRAKTDTEVPFLGRIPLIGMLFRSRSDTTQKTELVIFLTPHIVNADAVSPEAQDRLEIKADGTPKKKGFWRRLFGKRNAY